MRKITVLPLAAALSLIAACTAQQVESDPPTVTYTYSDDDSLEEAEQRAELYCEENYDLDAILVDRDEVTGGYEATYSCQ
ncbi:MAG: hypothetical protein ACREDZ_06055 [Kiloniellales bacterium]